MRRPFRATGLLLLAGVTTAAGAAELLGAWDYWAAFRSGDHCMALAKPVAGTRGGAGRPFLAVASWPDRGIRARLHARLSRPRPGDAPVRLTIGQRSAPMIGRGSDAWARAGADPAIVAAMRIGAVLRIESRDAAGRPFADIYRLAGLASAIDAAAIACTS